MASILKRTKIAIFASGSGSNALHIMRYFAHHSAIEVDLVVCNRSKAGVLEHAKAFTIDALVLSKVEDYESNVVGDLLQKRGVEYIILAGFLMKIPPSLIEQFENKIINIHPALLPKYGGKGMYGRFVHEAVKQNRDAESGISIHLVNEHFDEGRILFQKSCNILPEEDAEQIAAKVLKLEHEHYAPIIEQFIVYGL